MKKSKLLILLATLGLLASCGGAPKGSGENTLPSGGTTTDVKTEEGKQTLKSSLQKAATAMSEMPDSLELNVAASGINFALGGEVDVDLQGMPLNVKLNVNASDLNEELNVRAARHVHEGEEYDGVDAVVRSASSGSLAVNGSITAPDYEAMMAGEEKTVTTNFDASLSSNVRAYAYLVDGAKLYADLSDKGFDNTVSGVDTFLNKLYGELKPSIVGSFFPMFIGQVPFYDAEADKFDLKSMVDKVFPEGRKLAVDLPENNQVKVPAKSSSGEKPAELPDETLDQIVSSLETLGAKFVTYQSGAFGFELSLNKTTVAALLDQLVPASEDPSQPDVKKIFSEAITKLDAYAYAYFNANGLLEKSGFNWDVAASYDLSSYIPEGVDVKTAKANLSTKGSLLCTLKVGGVSVSFPSFDEYKEMNTGPLTLA